MANNEELNATAGSEDKKKLATLDTLTGPCADIINPTRNGRKYDNALWEKVFNGEIVKEYFANGGILGELGHPADRTETDPKEVAICMRQPPVKDKNGLLIGKWDILDTPNGRIAKTLVDYGYKLGISSRGNGDVYEDGDGTETVDEDTYDFQAFDLVLLPAVKAARLTPVKESLSGKTLRQALTEELHKAKDEDKAIMEKTINKLNIMTEENKETEAKPVVTESTPVIIKPVEASQTEATTASEQQTTPTQPVQEEVKKDNTLTESQQYNPAEAAAYWKLAKEKLSKEDFDKLCKQLGVPCEDKKDECISEKSTDKKDEAVEKPNVETKPAIEEAHNEGSEKLVKDLQEALKKNQELEKQIESLQNEKSVSIAKESKLNEELARYKQATITLSTTAAGAKALVERISKLESTIAEKDKQLTESKKTETVSTAQSLNESISKKDSEIESLKSNVAKLNESLTQATDNVTTQASQIEELKADADIKKSEYAKKLSQIHGIVEQYKKTAQIAVDKYIDTRATMLGVEPEEIKSRLSEGYTFDDIDNACEDLSAYQLNLNKLPFQLDGKRVKMKVTESKDPLITNPNVDDDVDESLITLANNIK